MELVADNFFTVHNKHTDNINTMYSKNRIGNRNVHSKLPIVVFQINSIISIESEEFRENSIACATTLPVVPAVNSSLIIHFLSTARHQPVSST